TQCPQLGARSLLLRTQPVALATQTVTLRTQFFLLALQACRLREAREDALLESGDLSRDFLAGVEIDQFLPLLQALDARGDGITLARRVAPRRGQLTQAADRRVEGMQRFQVAGAQAAQLQVAERIG